MFKNCSYSYSPIFFESVRFASLSSISIIVICVFTFSKALANLKLKITVIDIDDKDANLSDSKKIGEHEYEQFLNTGDENYEWKKPKDEWQAISLSYTSGTTGNPKGVVYHHRGSYLMATGSAVAWNMPNKLNFLYTVPMFHCNGWCFTWAVTAMGGTHVCLRQIDGCQAREHRHMWHVACIKMGTYAVRGGTAHREHTL